MAPSRKIPYFTKLDRELREALRRYKTNVGVPEAVQIDRALRAWLGERPEAWERLGVENEKRAGRRADTRRRS